MFAPLTHHFCPAWAFDLPTPPQGQAGPLPVLKQLLPVPSHRQLRGGQASRAAGQVITEDIQCLLGLVFRKLPKNWVVEKAWVGA